MKLKLTEKQYKAFTNLLQIAGGNKDSVISEIIHFHGIWGDAGNMEYSPLNNIPRYSLVEAVVKGDFEKLKTPLEEVERLISVYERRADAISRKENPLHEAFNDFVVELNDLKEIILNQEGAE
ncbi:MULTISPECIES: hypothetical protein [Bacillus amyloliquefaciens group]|uniref:hypothetical protein n=1 Tax=Bacillus amyloliquefaciens group TaxID=1938374 RepID=UPI000CA7E05D|nr:MULTISPECIES: hypothetical protein [Bacillus amyloliquefaciens group]MED5048870.1 hypothetical protein [Bacillus siamensis]MED5094943.1 hypothetical protein [Bacillus siamensis]PJN84864.1 hypothetical protein CV739_08975 [Bacillus velezensis]